MNLTYNKDTPGVIICANKLLIIEFVHYASGSLTKFGVWMFWCVLCCGLCLTIQALQERSPILITVYTRTCQFVLIAGHSLCLSGFIPQWRTKWCFSKVGCLTSTGFTLYGDWKWTFWRQCWFVNQGKSTSDSCKQMCRNISYSTRVSFLWTGFLCLGVPQEHMSLAGKYNCLNLYFSIICLWVIQLFPLFSSSVMKWM